MQRERVPSKDQSTVSKRVGEKATIIMSKKQDYIAKVRYQNDLPPPPIPPKLLNYQVSPNEEVDSPQLITSLYTKTNVTPLVKLNNDLGMPLDLMKIPGVLDQMDTKYLHGFENIKLHPNDRILLRDPRVDRLTKTDMSKVTFLRRTEYVSEANTAKISDKKRVFSEVVADDDKVLTPDQIVGKVENTFESITKDLSKIKHPVKKKVHAVKTWDLLPDTVSMDQTYFTVRLVGSAVLQESEKNKLELATALFRPVELEEDEWVSVYTVDGASSKELEKNLEQQIDEISVDNNVYKFKRLRDFDMKQLSPTTTGPFGELALRFNNERGVVYYKPLRPRIELRRRRINEVIKPLVRENNLDQINLKLRNPITQETKDRDKMRSRFDPIDFPNLEEELEDTKDTEPQDQDGKEGNEEEKDSN